MNYFSHVVVRRKSSDVEFEKIFRFADERDNLDAPPYPNVYIYRVTRFRSLQ